VSRLLAKGFCVRLVWRGLEGQDKTGEVFKSLHHIEVLVPLCKPPADILSTGEGWVSKKLEISPTMSKQQ
jgi:hypothetical protein